MQIHIEALCFETIIGVLEFERTTPQQVCVTCTIDYSYTHGTYIDYTHIIHLIKSTLLEGQFELLEEALLAIATCLHVNHPSIDALELKIAKPHIIPDAVVALSHRFVF